MAAAQQEYEVLIQKCTLTNKYAVKALQIIAETNDQHAQEIVTAIKAEISKEKEENKEALLSLLSFLGQHPSYSFLKASYPEKRSLSAEEPERKKKRKIEEVPEKLPEKLPEPEEDTAFLPFPPEYFLFKLVDKATYTASYIYYTEGNTASKTDPDDLPKLTHEYLTTPHLESAIKLLYTSATQCKVCGMRFDSVSAYTAHAEMHQKKSHLVRGSDILTWQGWLMEPVQWTKTETKVSVNLKPSFQEKVPTVPVRGDRDQKCTICGEAFEVIWSDESECWSFNDALIIRTMPREISHKRCVS
ncbi:hypothetical protein NEAUS03_1385 [Nematocida ausubeli]|nr:hypothetical protein NEAUS03_1385 [Nematocida ausubeli]